ncbi:glycoside hydrolase family 16 protein [Caballeronia glebae]|uniref:glycoside hydrolase family 16 protein n=1 Tax=Caballeronia glebae TaxID=1777143 RepID=UPI0038BBB8E9
MNRLIKPLFSAILVLISTHALSRNIEWAGAEWQIREGSGHPCASDIYDSDGIWIDDRGWLHLRLRQLASGKFACVEMRSLKRFGFGHYRFDVSGPIGSVDPNVVLGLFFYPPKDVGADGTNEIDVEIARWGRENAPQVNYTVWNRSTKGNRHREYHVPESAEQANFEIDWSADRVQWLSSFHPASPITYKGNIAESEQFVILNLWLFKSPRPSDGREVEFVIKSMKKND